MIIGLVAMVVAAIVAANTTDIVRFSPFTAGEFVQRFTPLFLASLFVERTVEVFITSWRDLASMRLKDAQKQAKLAVTTPEGTPAAAGAQDALTTAQRALTDYQAETRRWAFAGSVFLGVIVAGLGVRAFGLFVDSGEFEDLRQAQRVAFHTMDVILTAGVLAGGSDALHQFVTTFTSFMTTTRKNLTGGGP